MQRGERGRGRGGGAHHPPPAVNLPVTSEVEKKPEASPCPSGTPKLRDEIDAVFRSIDVEWNKLEEARKLLEKERSSFEEMKVWFFFSM